jgi:hypothetical protein
MKKTVLLFVAVLALAGLACAADDKPNFSGKWVLDVEKSDFGPVPAPTAQSQDIDHKDPKIKVKTVSKTQQGETTVESNRTTDGEENTNTMGGTEVKSKTVWDGKKLVTTMKRQIQGMDIDVKDTWELADDSKSFTITRELKTPQGDFTQKLLLKKE